MKSIAVSLNKRISKTGKRLVQLTKKKLPKELKEETSLQNLQALQGPYRKTGNTSVSTNSIKWMKEPIPRKTQTPKIHIRLDNLNSPISIKESRFIV